MGVETAVAAAGPVLTPPVEYACAAGVVPSPAMAGDKEPVEASEYATQESAQPMSDTWITTKVQAGRLATHMDVRGVDVKRPSMAWSS